MTRGNVLLLAVVAMVVAAAVVVFALIADRQPGGTPRTVSTVRGAVPAGARSAVRLLLSPGGRRALTPELDAALPRGNGPLFPAGSRFTPAARGWHQAGAFASVTGTVREPGRAAEQAEIGLVYRHGRWLVTFAGTL